MSDLMHAHLILTIIVALGATAVAIFKTVDWANYKDSMYRQFSLERKRAMAGEAAKTWGLVLLAPVWEILPVVFLIYMYRKSIPTASEKQEELDRLRAQEEAELDRQLAQYKPEPRLPDPGRSPGRLFSSRRGHRGNVRS